jgi:hypothetical protein
VQAGASSFGPGFIFPASRLYTRLLVAAYRRPALFRPRSWVFLLALAIALLVVLASLGLWLLLILPGFLLGVSIAGIAGWHRLMRPSERLLLALISRFAPSTAPAFHTTVDHQRAILDSLSN